MATLLTTFQWIATRFWQIPKTISNNVIWSTKMIQDHPKADNVKENMHDLVLKAQCRCHSALGVSFSASTAMLVVFVLPRTEIHTHINVRERWRTHYPNLYINKGQSRPMYTIFILLIAGPHEKSGHCTHLISNTGITQFHHTQMGHHSCVSKLVNDGQASQATVECLNISRSSQIDGLVQERRNSSALAMELRLSCTKPPKNNIHNAYLHCNI